MLRHKLLPFFDDDIDDLNFSTAPNPSRMAGKVGRNINNLYEALPPIVAHRIDVLSGVPMSTYREVTPKLAPSYLRNSGLLTSPDAINEHGDKPLTQLKRIAEDPLDVDEDLLF